MPTASFFYDKNFLYSNMKRKERSQPVFNLIRSKRANTGMPPGSLIFTGKRKQEKTNISLLQYKKDTEIQELQATDQLPEPLEGDYLYWYDVRGLHNIKLVQDIGKKYNIHPLILEDILDPQQRPKFETYEGGFFLIIQSLELQQEELEIRTEQIAIYVSEGLVISFQEDDTDFFASVRKRFQPGKGIIRNKGVDYLAYALIDTLVDHYYILMDQLELLIDELEEEILSNPGREIKAKIHHFKLQLIVIRKMISPLREAIHRFSTSESPLIQKGTSIFVRDLFDHIIQVLDSVETQRDVMNGLYDLHLSEISQKTNNVVQVLTIISTIFIPLSFLTGIYGMNFQHMPELEWEYGYFSLWLFMITLTLGLIIYFKRKKWL
jgi:magnesium transporter